MKCMNDSRTISKTREMSSRDGMSASRKDTNEVTGPNRLRKNTIQDEILAGKKKPTSALNISNAKVHKIIKNPSKTKTKKKTLI